MQSYFKFVSSSLFFGMVSFASADDLPVYKVGLWQSEVKSANMPSQSTKMCLDEATQKEMPGMGENVMKQQGASCTKNEIKKSGSGYSLNTDCNFNGINMKTTGTISGDFNSSITMTMTTVMNPPMMGMDKSVTTVTSKYLGACPAGMNPGDIEYGNGMKMNISQMKDMMKNLGNLKKGGATN